MGAGLAAAGNAKQTAEDNTFSSWTAYCDNNLEDLDNIAQKVQDTYDNIGTDNFLTGVGLVVTIILL